MKIYVLSRPLDPDRVVEALVELGLHAELRGSTITAKQGPARIRVEIRGAGLILEAPEDIEEWLLYMIGDHEPKLLIEKK